MKTILIIEDTSAILENLAEFLELEGYNILAAKNEKKGIELAQKFIPDLIICDVMMPIMDGHEVLSLLLKTSKTNEIPFISSTSLSEKLDVEKSMALGADDYITKPHELGDILKMAESWLEKGSQRHRDADLKIN